MGKIAAIGDNLYGDNPNEEKAIQDAKRVEGMSNKIVGDLNKRLEGKTIGKFWKNDIELNKYGQVTVSKLKALLTTIESRIKALESDTSEKGKDFYDTVSILYEKLVHEIKLLVTEINVSTTTATVSKLSPVEVPGLDSMTMALDVGDIDYAFECFGNIVNALM